MRTRFALLMPLVASLLVLGEPVAAQQFQFQPGAIPGPSVWSEGIEAFDANGDGWLDVIITNGSGFASPGGALAPTLLINQAVAGQAVFADETAARIPAGFTQQGKGLTTCDVNGDGHPDIVFANAFQNQPRVLVNDGTGVFTDQTATRFPTMNLNSFGVGSGDLDNDGDIDLVFNDHGTTTLGGAGAPPRLFINDGTGVFTNSPGQMNGVNKVAGQQVSMVDIDNDFDLDVVIDGRSSGQHLYLNDGTANFTFMGNILPAGSGNTYETDWADLDNDDDIDGAYVSLSGFSEGTARNDLAQSGTLSFVGSTNTLSGTNGNDDNEVAFIDANDDGLLDLLVASLGNSQEKLYLNGGTFAAGSFVFQNSGFTATSDSTLDLTIGDFNQDGAYDVVTAQGESGSFLNRLYLNTGPADTVPPRVRLETFSGLLNVDDIGPGGLVIRAYVQDATYDSGVTYAKASLQVTFQKGAFTSTSTVPMGYMGGGMWRGAVTPPPGLGLVGADITYSVQACDPMGNVTTSPTSSLSVCGAGGYGAPSAVNVMTIGTDSAPAIGSTFTIEIGNGPANQAAGLIASGAPTSFPIVGGLLLVDVSSPFVFPLTLDALGQAQVPLAVPPAPVAIGAQAYFQAFAFAPAQPQFFEFSTGLEIAICGFQSGPPVLTSATPLSAAPGTMITVIGSGFLTGALVQIGALNIATSGVTPTQLQFAMPAGLPCATTLRVRNPDTQTSGTIAFNPQPVITGSIFPAGTAAGNAIYVIQGSGFVPGLTSVTIGGNPPNMIVSSNDISIVLRTPPGTVGPATVVVTTPGGCSAMTTYTYQ